MGPMPSRRGGQLRTKVFLLRGVGQCEDMRVEQTIRGGAKAENALGYILSFSMLQNATSIFEHVKLGL